MLQKVWEMSKEKAVEFGYLKQDVNGKYTPTDKYFIEEKEWEIARREGGRIKEKIAQAEAQKAKKKSGTANLQYPIESQLYLKL